jgi:hypothetical protein
MLSMSDQIEIPIKVSLPLDQGYLRRECPVCLRQFKWWSGHHPSTPADAEDPAKYHCPYCNATAGPGSWYTQPQIEIIQSAKAHAVQDLVQKELGPAIRELNRSGLIQAELRSEHVPDSVPLDEPPDMHEVVPPCHSHEPLKVEDDWADPVHCIVCGEPFEPTLSG